MTIVNTTTLSHAWWLASCLWSVNLMTLLHSTGYEMTG